MPLRIPAVLYPLKPIGMGTADVESLSGYIARLALAHRVPVTHLLFQPLDSSGITLAEPGDRRWNLSHVDGRGSFAIRYVNALAALTGLSNLQMLTCVPLADVVADKWLLHEVQHWCPYCFQDQQEMGITVYEPLYWMLSTSTLCAHHERLLHDQCPFCHQQFRPLRKPHIPGYCGQCGRWLGTVIRPDNEASADVEGRERTEATRQLLAAGRKLQGQPELRQRFLNNLSKLQEFAGGYSRWQKVTHINFGNLYSLKRGSNIPSLPSILKLARTIRANPAALFLQDLVLTAFMKDLVQQRKESLPPKRRQHARVIYTPADMPEDEVRKRACDIIDTHDFSTAMRVHELAAHIGCRFNRLIKVVPDVRERLMNAYIDAVCAPIKQEIMETGHSHLSGTAVARTLDISISTLNHYQPYFVAQLRDSRSHRVTLLVRQRSQQYRQALEDILAEDRVVPTITDIAHTLGVTRHYLANVIPDLSMQLIARRKQQMAAHRTQQMQELAIQIHHAIQLLEAEGVSVTVSSLKRRFGFSTWNGILEQEVAKYQQRRPVRE